MGKMGLNKKIEKEFEEYIESCCKHKRICFSDIRTLQIALRDFKSICKRIRNKRTKYI